MGLFGSADCSIQNRAYRTKYMNRVYEQRLLFGSEYMNKVYQTNKFFFHFHGWSMRLTIVLFNVIESTFKKKNTHTHYVN